MTPTRVFLDSDVIIASLLSEKGASYFFLHDVGFANIDFFITDFSLLEIQEVIKRHPIEAEKLSELVEKRLTVKKLDQASSKLKRMQEYVSDDNDMHIIAGASQVKVKFLITYNITDFKIDLIHKAFDIKVIRPAGFLQYLRSLR